MKKSIIGLMCMSMIAGSFMGCSGKAVVETTAKETQKATETVETESVLSEEIVDAQTEEVETFKHPIEKYFPEDWAGRYIVEENENNGISVYCKMAAEQEDKNGAWLFSIYHIVGHIDPPAYTDLGMYEGSPVYGTMPWEDYQFSSAEVQADYEDMIYEVGDVFDNVKNYLSGTKETVEDFQITFDMNNYDVPGALDASDSIVGLYKLMVSDWSEESKNTILHPDNQYSIISIAPDGTLFISRGYDTVQGTAYLHKNYRNMTTDEPLLLLVFEDGVMHPAYLVQMVLTVHGMEPYIGISGEENTSWNFMYSSEYWWTEEPVAYGG